MSNRVRTVYAVLAALFGVWALYLFFGRSELTLDSGAVRISCDSIAETGSQVRGDERPQPTFDEKAGKLPLESPGNAKELEAAWALMNVQCSDRRTYRLAVLMFVLVPTTVLTTVSLFPSTRRPAPAPAPAD